MPTHTQTQTHTYRRPSQTFRQGTYLLFVKYILCTHKRIHIDSDVVLLQSLHVRACLHNLCNQKKESCNKHAYMHTCIHTLFKMKKIISVSKWKRHEPDDRSWRDMSMAHTICSQKYKLCVCVCIHTYTHTHTYIHIHIYTKRSRPSAQTKYKLCVYIHSFTHMLCLCCGRAHEPDDRSWRDISMAQTICLKKV